MCKNLRFANSELLVSSVFFFLVLSIRLLDSPTNILYSDNFNLRWICLRFGRQLWNRIWRHSQKVVLNASEAALTVGRWVPQRGVETLLSFNTQCGELGELPCHIFHYVLAEWWGHRKWNPNTNIMTSDKCEQLWDVKFKQGIEDQLTDVRKIISKNTQ